MKSKKGVAMVEILVSIAVLSSIGLALLSGLSTFYKADQINNNKITAVGIAQSQLEYFDGLTYLPATNQVADYGLFTGTLPAGYSIQSVKGDGTYSTTHLLAAPWNSQTGTLASIDAGLQRIRLVVLQGTKVAVTLDDYKVQIEQQ
jgi:type II secretory pathway pseudopilin PulG